MPESKSVRRFMQDWQAAIKAGPVPMVIELPEGVRQNIINAGGDPDSLYVIGMDLGIDSNE